MKPWQTNNRVLLILQEAIYPFEYGLHFSIKSIKNAWNHYIDLHDAALQNDQLRSQLALLQTRIIDYEHQIQEVTRLRKLLGFTQAYDREVTVAEVVNLSIGTPFQSIRIARGQKDNIWVGMPVVSAKGIVGRILRVGQNFSDIQLISDSSFHLDVLIERTRTRGVLQGIGQNRCRLQLHRRADIRIGDTLITSGIVGGFPKGLPVGQVIKISYESDDVSQMITIQPWIDYRQLEEVVILHLADEGIETIGKTAGQDWVNQTLEQSGHLK